jgi:hypothetical protein
VFGGSPLNNSWTTRWNVESAVGYIRLVFCGSPMELLEGPPCMAAIAVIYLVENFVMEEGTMKSLQDFMNQVYRAEVVVPLLSSKLICSPVFWVCWRLR